MNLSKKEFALAFEHIIEEIFSFHNTRNLSFVTHEDKFDLNIVTGQSIDTIEQLSRLSDPNSRVLRFTVSAHHDGRDAHEIEVIGNAIFIENREILFSGPVVKKPGDWYVGFCRGIYEPDFQSTEDDIKYKGKLDLLF